MINEKGGTSFESLYEPKDRLKNILSKPLTPEVVDTYASETLDQLVGLIQDTIDQYNRQPTVGYESIREQEEAAFAYYGLQNIEVLLDFVADKQVELNQIDTIIAEATEVSKVIIPADSIVRPQKADGSREFVLNKHVPRLKTTLFVLLNEFGIDIDDKSQCLLIKGTVDETMMRKESYYALSIPSLERTILVCDEFGNATFVFNSGELATLGVDLSLLVTMKKSELNDFVQEHSNAGQRLNYSKSFIPKLLQLIDDPSSNIGDGYRAKYVQNKSYLEPIETNDDGYLSVHSMTPIMGVNYRTLRDVADLLEEQLVDALPFRHTRGISYKYSPRDQVIIRNYLEEKGYYSENAPDYILPAKKIAEKYDASNGSVLQAIDALGEKIGITKLWRFVNQIAVGYDPDQQDLIYRTMVEMGLTGEDAPEGVLPFGRAAVFLNVSLRELQKAIPKINEIGEVRSFQFRSKIAPGLDERQIMSLRTYFDNQ